jgi:hypothetical protein
LVFYSLSSLILSNLKHELLNLLKSTMAANVLKILIYYKARNFFMSLVNLIL